jgi:hypothetical protein
MAISKSDVMTFLQRHNLMVLASVGNDSQPEAALVEYAVAPSMEIIFDTLDNTRKCSNFRQIANVACVVGWDAAETLQLEGVVDEPSEAELSGLLPFYFAACPAGRLRKGWPGLTYFRVRPRWGRLSNYNCPRHVEELSLG